MSRDTIAKFTQDNDAYSGRYQQLVSIEQDGRCSIGTGRDRQTVWYKKALDWFLRDEDAKTQIKRAKVQFLEAIEEHYGAQAYKAVKALMESHLGGVRTSSPLTNRFARECVDLAEKVWREMLENFRGSLNKPLPESFAFKVNHQFGTWSQYIETYIDDVVRSTEDRGVVPPAIINWLKCKDSRPAIIRHMWNSGLFFIAEKTKWKKDTNIEDQLCVVLERMAVGYMRELVQWSSAIYQLVREAGELEGFGQLEPMAMNILLGELQSQNRKDGSLDWSFFRENKDQNLLAISVFFGLQRVISNDHRIKPGDRLAVLIELFNYQLVQDIARERGKDANQDAIALYVQEILLDKLCENLGHRKHIQETQKSVLEKIFSDRVQGSITENLNNALAAQYKVWEGVYLSENVRQKGVEKFNGNQQVLATIRSHMYSMRSELAQQVSDWVLKKNAEAKGPPTYQELQEDVAEAVEDIFRQKCREPFSALLKNWKLPENVEIVENVQVGAKEEAEKEAKRVYTVSRFVQASQEEIETLRQTMIDFSRLEEPDGLSEAMVSHVFAITRHLLGPKISDTPDSYPWDDLSSQERESFLAACFNRAMVQRVKENARDCARFPLEHFVVLEIKRAWKMREDLLAKGIISLKRPQEAVYFLRNLLAIYHDGHFKNYEQNVFRPDLKELGDFALVVFAEVYKTFGSASEKEKMACCKAALTLNNFLLFRKSRQQLPKKEDQDPFKIAKNQGLSLLAPSREDIVNSSHSGHGVLAHYQYQLQVLVQKCSQCFSQLESPFFSKVIQQDVLKQLLEDIQFFEKNLKQYSNQKAFTSLFLSTWVLKEMVKEQCMFLESFNGDLDGDVKQKKDDSYELFDVFSDEKDEDLKDGSE